MRALSGHAKSELSQVVSLDGGAMLESVVLVSCVSVGGIKLLHKSG
jgi:hypothetical protein